MNTGQMIAFALGGLGLLVLIAAGWALRFWLGRRRAERVWACTRVSKLEGLGVVERLAVLPLVDDIAAPDSEQALATESGVSYLVRAGDQAILFDLGLNRRGEHPSPLLRNAAALGVHLEDIDCVFISHPHLDHVGGMRYARRHTFALSGAPVPLEGVPAFVPAQMFHPTANVVPLDGPRALAPGVASSGPIPRQLFFLDWTPEQALIVHVAGKGIVLVVGCGHPTIQRLVERAEALLDVPLYGIVGGLHYPVSRTKQQQRTLGTDRWPWALSNASDAEASIAFLKTRPLCLLALSPHDSCERSRAAFRQAFGAAYQDVQVGKEIVVE